MTKEAPFPDVLPCSNWNIDRTMSTRDPDFARPWLYLGMQLMRCRALERFDFVMHRCGEILVVGIKQTVDQELGGTAEAGLQRYLLLNFD